MAKEKQEREDAANTVLVEWGGGCNLRGTFKTVRLLTPVKNIVSIRNSAGKNLRLFWINPQGAETDYQNASRPIAYIWPNRTQVVEGFVDYGFALLDDAGNCAGIIQATASRNIFEIMAPSREDTAREEREAKEKQDREDAAIMILVPRGGGCALRGTYRSPRPQEVDENFTSIKNAGNSTLRLFWIDTQGKNANYSGFETSATEQRVSAPLFELAPGQTFGFESWVGFGFALLDEAGNCAAVVQATAARNIFTIMAEERSLNPGTVPGGSADSAQTVVAAGTACSTRGTFVSPSTANPATTDLVVTNNRATNIRIFWIDYQGRETDYQGTVKPIIILAPGQTQTIQAFAWHGFALLDDNGGCAGVIQARPSGNNYALAANASGGGNSTGGNATNQPDSGGGGTRISLGCKARGFVVSSGGSQLTSISFANNGAGDIHVYWVDGDGKETDYQGKSRPLAVIPARQSGNFEAYVGHSFVVLDAGGNCLGVLQTSESSNDFMFAANSGPGATADPTGQPKPEQANPQHAASCDLRGRIASTSDNQEMTVTFANSGSTSVFVYWIDYQGGESDYQSVGRPLIEVAPGRTKNVQAFGGYAFSVFDQSSNCLGVAQTSQTSNHFDFAANGAGDRQPAPGQGQTQASGGCELRGQITSGGTNQPASVTFSNTGTNYLHVYWISFDGIEGDYNSAQQPLVSLAPGQSQSINAAIGYAFSVLDGNANCFGVAQISKQTSDFAFQ